MKGFLGYFWINLNQSDEISSHRFHCFSWIIVFEFILYVAY
jgi:hypothetical protein